MVAEIEVAAAKLEAEGEKSKHMKPCRFPKEKTKIFPMVRSKTKTGAN